MSHRKTIQPTPRLGVSRPSGASAADEKFKVKDTYMLSRKRIRASFLKTYSKGLNKFFEWLPDGERLIDGEHVDQVLHSFAHYVCEEHGENCRSWVEQAKAGIAFYFPEYASSMHKINLDLQGWRRTTPATAYKPLPRIVAFRYCAQASRSRCSDFALRYCYNLNVILEWVTFTIYIREV
eukprot:IDg22329t1